LIAALATLSKEELIAEVITLRATLADLNFKNTLFKEELAELKRLIYGSKSERFAPAASPEQLTLGLAAEEKPAEVKTEKVEYTRVKPKAIKNHKGRLPLPAHLPRVEHIIEPEESTEGMRFVGEEITETLDYIPGKLQVKKYIRKKYARPHGEGIVIGRLPSRLIEKGIAEASLLAYLLTSKYADHLPLHRQIEMLKRLGVTLPASTVSDWISYSLKAIMPLYECLVTKVQESNYLQADETPIKVLDKDKKGTTHRGYYWVYHAVKESLIFFDYREGRSREGPSKILKNYKGYLQTDGYGAYDDFGQKEDITLVHCMAHARRYFEKALGNHKEAAEHALQEIQKLYQIERKCREGGIKGEERKRIREGEALSVLKDLHSWMMEQYEKVNPSSSIGEALSYSLKRWEGLTYYIKDGDLEIDNNLIENAIRPVAIGRKNYLFAGSHEAAQRAAMMYSLFACCKKNDVNPHEWLIDVLNRISDHPINKIEELLPNNWKESKM
jgi:transposase